MTEYTLDITAEICPMTLVKTKLKLEEMAIGDVLRIRLRDGEARRNVPVSLRDHGHEVIAEHALDDGSCIVVVRKDQTA